MVNGFSIVSKIAFLFPGQGAQFVGMGQALFAEVPNAQALFKQADDILGYSLSDLCFHGPDTKLNTTAISQPAIFVTSLAALESLRLSNPLVVEQCQAAAGLSLGEYTALVFAGVLSFADGLRLVQRRGEAMQAAADATPSGMLSILGAEIAQIEAWCSQARSVGSMQVANLLCPNNTVVSGSKAACDEIDKIAQAAGARTVRLNVAGAFHTPIMKPADQALAEVLSGSQLQKAKLPVWSNVDAQPHEQPDDIRSLLVRQVLEPVRWEATIRGMMEQGFDTFYEIGPGRVLAGLLKRINRKTECINIGA